MSKGIEINPKILVWARKSANIARSDAAKKAGVTEEVFALWETGEAYPTVRQAKMLAKAYRRPFALFFLSEIPKEFQPLQDFRRPGSKPLSTSSIFIMREVLERQQWIKSHYEENGVGELNFIGRFSIADPVQSVADDILKTIFPVSQPYGTDNILLQWISALESNGIFISRTGFIHSRMVLHSDEILGFAIADRTAPFIFVNSQDWRTSQLFTLIHELVHLWIAESGVSGETEFSESQTGAHPVEVFCNRAAAMVLMPEARMQSINPQSFSNLEELIPVAKKFGVSTQALIYRAFDMKLINRSDYLRIKKENEAAFQSYLLSEKNRKAKSKDADGGPSFYLLQLLKNGKLFTRTVMDAYHGGQIHSDTASGLLNIKINQFVKMEAEMG